MAAVTILAQSSDERTNPHATTGAAGLPAQKKLSQCKLRKFGPIASAASGDTLETGITSIVEVAWKGNGGTDQCNPHFDATGLVTFDNDGGAVQGVLYVWSGI